MNSESNNQLSVKEMVRSANVHVAPQIFTLVSFSRGEFADLLNNTELSPGGASPYMVFWDGYEVTLMIDQSDFRLVQESLVEAKVETGFRLLTFDLVMTFDIIGFIAEVSQILAASGVSILPVSAFSRDHILIKQEKLATALKALSEHVADLC